MGTADDAAIENARRRVTDEVFVEQRELVDWADAIGISLISIGVPIALWDHVDHTRLIVWGALLFAATWAWKFTTESDDMASPFLRAVRSVWIWGSSIIWAGLPWIQPSAVEIDEVAWVLVFVVSYGIASDVVFIPQTGETALVPLLAGYTSSYLLAFLVAGQWVAATAVASFLFLLVLGGNGWKRLTRMLIDRRVEGEVWALVDDLTGVGTRAAATLAVEQMIDDGVAEVHCVFLDVDDFKQLNDTYGYAAGDAALRTIASRFVETVPDSWSVARFGGDEFVAVGPEGADLDTMSSVLVPLPNRGPGAEIDLSLSVGRTMIPAASASSEVLFREAGTALRAAKAAGKNQVVTMSARLRAREAERLELANAVGYAIEQRQIVPYGQAINDLRTGRAVGVELLARWPRADGSMVMPNDFVPVIEEQGRGPQLGDLMVEYAVDFLADLRERGRTDVYASVNISARHLFHRSLAGMTARELERRRVPPHQLVLEITETQYLPQSSVWRQTAEQVRQLGVGLAIDDFGTGYSSMSQLLSMPFTHLKVDRIITSSQARPGTSDLAAGIAAMAHGGDMTAIAEGIETPAERDQMIACGYLYGQGFYYGRPRPLDELMATFTEPVDDPAR